MENTVSSSSKTPKIYFTLSEGKLSGFYEEGLCEIPDGATEISQNDRASILKAEAKGKIIVMKDGKLTPVDPPPVPSDWAGADWKPNPEMIKKNAVELRKSAYKAETDDMVYDVLAGDIDVGIWKAKRAEIKARYPKE